MPEIKNRGTEKIITIGEDAWKLHKMSAYDGAYIGYTLLNSALPPMFAQAISGDAGKVAAAGPQMGKEQFKSLMQDMLRTVEKRLEAGYVPAVDAHGNFQIIGLETDLPLCIRLVAEAIKFNFADFFTDSGLLDAVAGLMGMSR